MSLTDEARRLLGLHGRPLTLGRLASGANDAGLDRALASVCAALAAGQDHIAEALTFHGAALNLTVSRVDDVVTLAWVPVAPTARPRDGGDLALALAAIRTVAWDWAIGREPGPLAGKIHPDDAARLDEIVQAGLRAPEGTFEATVRVRPEPDAAWRWTHVQGMVVGRDGYGRPLRAVGTLRDVTEDRRRTAVMESQRALATAALESVEDAVVTVDPSARVVFLNPAAKLLTGWSTEQARGRPIAQVVNLRANGTASGASVLTRVLEGDASVADEELLLSGRHGTSAFVALRGVPLRTAAGARVGSLVVIHDRTRHRALAAQVQHAATHDAMTGLITRRELERLIQAALKTAGTGERRHALVILDIDRFKIINDAVGHRAGDELLRRFSDTLRQLTPRTCALARIGGNEFAALLLDVDVDDAEVLVEQMLMRLISTRFVWGARTFEISVSAGVAGLDRYVGGRAEVMSRADVACQLAKEHGGGRVHVYREEDIEVTRRYSELQMAADLSVAMDERRFRLARQPIVPLGTGVHPTHYELLLRLEGRDGQLISPGAFIPAAERFGLMPGLDRWVVNAALDSYAQAFDADAQDGISINLSGQTMAARGSLGYVRSQLEAAQVPFERVCFEITETALVQNMGKARTFMNVLRRMGCTFALDDFGTGVSSMVYLKELPVDYLKFDGRFIRNIVHDQTDFQMVSALNHMAHALGIRTVAEFVEDQPTLETVRKIGIDYAQGYHIGRPALLPPSTLTLPA